MAANQCDSHHREPGQRRPMCGVCTKPLRLCLCGRLRSPPLDTAVGVTILQHVMEANHPLNSTRVVRLGLRNLAVVQVGDVNHRATFHLTTLDSVAGNRRCSDGPGEDDGGNVSEFQMAAAQNCNGICKENVETGAVIAQGWTVKNMDKCSIAYTEKELQIDIERGVKPKIRWLSRGLLGLSAVSNGFTVTKIQMKKSKLTGEVSVFEEFTITIPPNSALLFPCQRAISIDASGCHVQHLIVLDGTWAKAQRMYHENPWLQLLPHVKIESDGASLYSEVRHEPRAGCLSTIESIVVAMRKLGEDAKGLDNLLDVFGSMIADQRRCKDENWKHKLESKT
uniref:tRNA-uridine aminocarboxypropyltransferase n=1 Tax=Leersia perrieri TaxID=77586 RepID=A0A0D9VVS1_9ORYZ